MATQWTEDLATSVAEIDNQHKELFRRINELHLACKKGMGKHEIGQAIRFLEEYAKTHFEAEEKYMRVHNYPGYASHKAEHIVFTKTVVDLKKQFETEGPSLPLVIKTNLELAEWLRTHIRKVDINLGSFLKNQGL